MVRLKPARAAAAAAAVLAMALSPASAAGSREILSLEQIVTLHTVGEARIAPDGKDVVYVVGRESVVRGTRPQTQIWTAATAGGPPRLLLTAEGAETEPRWSPDGATIAYLASRAGGGRQIHVVRRDGQEERALGEGTVGAAPLVLGHLQPHRQLGADPRHARLSRALAESTRKRRPRRGLRPGRRRRGRG